MIVFLLLFVYVVLMLFMDGFARAHFYWSAFSCVLVLSLLLLDVVCFCIVFVCCVRFRFYCSACFVWVFVLLRLFVLRSFSFCVLHVLCMFVLLLLFSPCGCLLPCSCCVRLFLFIALPFYGVFVLLLFCSVRFVCFV